MSNRVVHRVVAYTLTAAICAACAEDPVVTADKHSARADAYVAKGQLEEAVIEYSRALQARPEAADIRYRLGQVYEQQGDATKAFQEFARSADLDPRRIDAQIKAGNALLGAGDFEAARARAALALKVDSQHVPALILHGNALAGLNDTNAALTQIEQALTLDPSSVPAWTAMGTITYVRGAKADAASAFEKAVALNPASIEAHLALANYRWASGDLIAAERTMKTALGIEGSNRAPHQWLAFFYVATRRASEAEPHFRALATDARGQLALADYLAGVGRHAEARTTLIELESDVDPKVARAARLRHAGVLYATGEKADAHSVIDRMLKEGTTEPAVHLAKGRMLLADGGPASEIADHARAALSSNYRDAAAHYVLGLAQLSAKDLEGATKSFEEVVRINPRAAAGHLQLARVRLATGDVASAARAAERAVREEPADVEATVLLVRSLRAQGSIQRAAEELDRSLSRLPRAIPLHTEKGWLDLQRKEFAAARSAFNEALRLDPQSATARSGLIASDLAAGQIDAARAKIAAWQRRDSQSSHLQLLAARVEVAAGRPEAAVRVLQELTTADASNSEAYQMLAQIYAAQGKTLDAVTQFESLARREPGAAAGARTAIGMLHDVRNDRASARAAYEEALRADPNAAVAANNLAWIYAAEGRLEEALKLATAAHKALKRPESEHTLGWVYFQMGLTAQAINAFESARRHDPKRALYHYHAGLALLKAGDRVRAQAAFEKALAIESRFEGAADAQAQLTALQRK